MQIVFKCLFSVLVVFLHAANASEKVKLAELHRIDNAPKNPEEVRTLEIPKMESNEGWKKTECARKSGFYEQAVDRNGNVLQRPGQSPLDSDQEQCVGTTYEVK